MSYGKAPEVVGTFNPDWHEYMHYLYLPVVIPGLPAIRLPTRLEFLRPLAELVARRERSQEKHPAFPTHPCFMYVTARRGYATPGNPLNRPGWHADGFGTSDVNYIWTDRYATRFAVQEFTDISTDHVRSAEQFEEQVDPENIVTYPPYTLLRLDPFVVHAVPEIPAPGERSFLKLSISTDRYNLRGNSHNHLFNYNWKMWARDEVRNDPAYAGGDAGPQA